MKNITEVQRAPLQRAYRSRKPKLDSKRVEREGTNPNSNMASTTRVRGILSTTDAAPAAPLIFYIEGTRDVVAIGASDILHIDSYCVSHESGLATDTCSVFFSDDGAEDAGSTIYMGEMPSSTQASNATLTLPYPVSGLPGETLYAVAGDTKPLRVVATGHLYQA
jgi:hypothetical protein